MGTRLNLHGEKNGPAKGEGGAPRRPIDTDVVRRSAAIGCTIEEIAAVVGVAPDTISSRMHRDERFRRAIEEGRASGRATLRRLQWQQASAGNPTMLIWLGKQMLGQRDKHEIGQEDGRSITFLHLVAARAISEQINGTPQTIDAETTDVDTAQKPPPNLMEPALE